MKRGVVVAIVLACLGLSVVAHADERARVRARLAEGKALFDDQEYRKAIRTLAPIPHDPAADRAQRIRALELIGMSYLILGQEDRARDAFQDLLAIDPGYQLRDDTGSPKIRTFFDDVKNKYVPGFDPNAVAELEYTAPRRATGGRRVEVDVRVVSGGGRVKEVVVKWRRPGLLDYGDAQALRIRGDHWRAKFRVPESKRAYAIDYYIEARDIAGGSIGRVGGPETPLTLRVGAGVVAVTPWYKRWYTLAGAAVVVGAGTALIVTSGDDAPTGSLDPGTVTLTP